MNDFREKLEALKKTIYEVKEFLSVEDKETRTEELKGQMAAPDFWSNQEKSKPVIEEMKAIKAIVEPWKKAYKEYEDLDTLFQLASDEGDMELMSELQKRIGPLERTLANLELTAFLSGAQDSNNAYLMIHSGAGGTEACDWAEMLLRMYHRWAERRGFSFQVIDIQPGDEAGVKSVTAMVSGAYVYGYLKAERGVHRLVRISPFDTNKRRHTSFASIDVAPEISDEVEIEIDDKDLRVDTYRASGAGGQHVNKTDSAVRITHLPSKIVVQCQNERSQHKNRVTAMKLLRARMYEVELEKKEAEAAKERGLKKKIEWGSQIRSYVFHPYTLVKDLRTDFETSNGERVMDGQIDDFIEAYLKMK